MDVPEGGTEESERVAPACEEVESGEPDTVTGGTEDEVIGVGARDELSDEVVDVQDESEYESCFADTASVGEIEQGGGRDQVVDLPDTGEVDCQKMFKMVTRARRRKEKTNMRPKKNSQVDRAQDQYA